MIVQLFQLACWVAFWPYLCQSVGGGSAQLQRQSDRLENGVNDMSEEATETLKIQETQYPMVNVDESFNIEMKAQIEKLEQENLIMKSMLERQALELKKADGLLIKFQKLQIELKKKDDEISLLRDRAREDTPIKENDSESVEDTAKQLLQDIANELDTSMHSIDPYVLVEAPPEEWKNELSQEMIPKRLFGNLLRRWAVYPGYKTLSMAVGLFQKIFHGQIDSLGDKILELRDILANQPISITPFGGCRIECGLHDKEIVLRYHRKGGNVIAFSVSFDLKLQIPA